MTDYELIINDIDQKLQEIPTRNYPFAYRDKYIDGLIDGLKELRCWVVMRQKGIIKGETK